MFGVKHCMSSSLAHANVLADAERHLAVLPNHKVAGHPNLIYKKILNIRQILGKPNPSNTKIYLSNFEYNLLDKRVEYSDQLCILV